MKFVIKKIKSGKHAGQFRFEIIAGNNEKIDPRQPYNSKQSVKKTIALLKNSALCAPVVDKTK